jgi:hypothetical protein
VKPAEQEQIVEAGPEQVVGVGVDEMGGQGGRHELGPFRATPGEGSSHGESRRHQRGDAVEPAQHGRGGVRTCVHGIHEQPRKGGDHGEQGRSERPGARSPGAAPDRVTWVPDGRRVRTGVRVQPAAGTAHEPGPGRPAPMAVRLRRVCWATRGRRADSRCHRSPVDMAAAWRALVSGGRRRLR